MVIHRGLEVAVVVDGRDLTEYLDDEEGPANTITRYVEVVSGAKFSVRFKHTQDFLNYNKVTGIKCTIGIDGEHMVNRLGCSAGVSSYLAYKEFEIDGQHMTQDFRFANIQIDENANVKASGTPALSQSIAKIGTLEVKVWRIKSSVPMPGLPRKLDGHQSKVGKPVPEKALKGQAISHQLSLDPMKRAEPVDWFTCDYLDKFGPFLTFVFKYRSRRALQALCVIPRSPSPTSFQSRPDDELSREELLKALKEARANGKKIKTEGHDEQRTAVKREADAEFDEILASARSAKVPRHSQATEVIDLSDD